jgi:hypothetical protein
LAWQCGRIECSQILRHELHLAASQLRRSGRACVAVREAKQHSNKNQDREGSSTAARPLGRAWLCSAN